MAAELKSIKKITRVWLQKEYRDSCEWIPVGTVLTKQRNQRWGNSMKKKDFSEHEILQNSTGLFGAEFEQEREGIALWIEWDKGFKAGAVGRLHPEDILSAIKDYYHSFKNFNYTVEGIVEPPKDWYAKRKKIDSLPDKTQSFVVEVVCNFPEKNNVSTDTIKEALTSVSHWSPERIPQVKEVKDFWTDADMLGFAAFNYGAIDTSVFEQALYSFKKSKGKI